MKNKNLYSFVLRLALTFRLSLKNVCKILGRNCSNEEQMKLYDEFDELFGNNLNLKKAYNYLFNYETIGETSKLSDRALGMSNMFLLSYKQACKKGSKEDILKIDSKLNKLDRDFENLKRRENNPSVTDEEAIIISKYRVKYALSRECVCDMLGLSYHSLRLREQKLQDEVLKHKLSLLSDFYMNMVTSKRNVR